MNELEIYDELVEECQKIGLELKLTSNGYSIVYNENLENIILSLLNDFYSYEGYNLLLQNHEGELSISLDTNYQDLTRVMLLNQIGDSIDRYLDNFDYLASMNSELKAFYDMFKSSLEYSGNFGIGFLNSPTKKKYIIKTDMPEMKGVLEKAGFEFEGDKVVVPGEEIDRFYEILEMEQNKEGEKEEDKKEDNSKVDFYEKIITTAAGIDTIVRLSIVKQDKEEGQYDRLVNISYISKETGVLTSNEVIGYEDAHDFDNNVLPSIIDGFQKNVVLSGRKVEVNEVNSTKCYLTSGNGENDIYLDGYYVNGIRSLLDYNSEYNLVNEDVNLQELYKEEIIDKPEDESTFEGDVTDTKDDSEELSYSEEGPKMVKKLGEMPSNERGLSNSVSLALFLAIDVVAIFVGLFLLMH